MNRRHFVQYGLAGTGLLLTRSARANQERTRITILHTNDTHSRIDPFPMDGGQYQGLGGVARRAALINDIRALEQHVLLLDSGDIFQGTPYFNFFDGEIEFKTMSALGYDAATLGNHDFDNGVDGLVKMLPHARFPFVSANYQIGDPGLAPAVQPTLIKTFGQVKVGIFGLGIDFERLVLAGLHEGVSYSDPIASARKSVEDLRNAGCSLIVCLSHLGYRYRGDRVSDMAVANEVEGIDLLLGGHTHTFLDEPVVVTRPTGGKTLVAQVGFAGIRLGRIDVEMDNRRGPMAWIPGGYTIGPPIKSA